MRPNKGHTFRQHRVLFPCETFLNNQLDKDVQSILFPLNFTQLVVLNPKCHIKNSFINPNNSWNKVILLFGMIIYVSAYLYRVLEISFDPNLRAYGTLSFLYIASYFDFVFYSTGFILNFIFNFSKTKDMVNLILTYQEVNRFLKDKSNFKWSVIRSWIHVSLLFGFYIFTMLFMSLAPFHIVFNLIILMSLDSNIIYTIILLKLLTEKVVVWNSKILKIQKGCIRACCKSFDIYVDIFSCYNLIKDIFQQPILYQTIETFFRCLVNVQVMIEFRKVFFVKTPYVSLFLYSGMVKTLILQLTLSLTSESFYDAVKRSKESCEYILGSSCEDDNKKLCKNILRLHRSFKKINACGLFYMDISQPLQLMILLTNYTVVLLQFAFL